MPSLDIMIGFFVATGVFAFMPGPAMLYTTAQTIARGRWAGFMASIGIHIGGYAHVIAATLGLSVIFHSVPLMYTLLKFSGALYLLYLGVRMLMEANKAGPAKVSPKTDPSAKKAFLQSIAVEVLNPKTSLFFIAFLPQFTEVTALLPIWAQFLILGSIANMAFTLADLICVYTANNLSNRFNRSNRAQKITKIAGGTILIGLGANIAARQN